MKPSARSGVSAYRRVAAAASYSPPALIPSSGGLLKSNHVLILINVRLALLDDLCGSRNSTCIPLRAQLHLAKWRLYLLR